jgi:alcohol dehydrogenase class IV
VPLTGSRKARPGDPILLNAHYVSGNVPPVVAGPGSAERLAEYLPGATRSILIVCDAGVAAVGLPEAVEAALPADIAVERFVAPAGEPKFATIDTAAARARALAAHGLAIVGLGGGTAMDIAKLAAALVHNPGPVADYVLGRQPFTGRAPAVMVPTTAGTGAEIARTCILGDADGRKLWAWSPALAPDRVVLDPALTRTLPHPITIATGLDAFAHALEAATGQATNRWIEAMGLSAIRLVATHLETLVGDPEDLDARQAMQEAALLAGIAIDAGGTGVAHNLAHALGTCSGVPHGVAVALGLRASLGWSVDGAPGRFAASASTFAGGVPAARLPEAVSGWMDRLGFDAVAAASLDAMPDAQGLADCMAADENRPMLRNSARPPEDGELAGLAAAVVAECERAAARAPVSTP